MIPERHPLRQLFHEVVAGCYHRHSGIDDPELTSYVGDLLTEFTAAESLYRIRNPEGKPVKDVREMIAASDPVFGAAASFDEERKVRRHIGDYALFATGMYPETMQLWKHSGDASFVEMVKTGRRATTSSRSLTCSSIGMRLRCLRGCPMSLSAACMG